jgi:hypothetical protein
LACDGGREVALRAVELGLMCEKVQLRSGSQGNTMRTNTDVCGKLGPATAKADTRATEDTVNDEGHEIEDASGVRRRNVM